MKFWLRTSDQDPGLGHKMRILGLSEQLIADGHDVLLERDRREDVIEVIDSYTLKPVTKNAIEIGMRNWWFLRNEMRGLRRGRSECKAVGYSWGGGDGTCDYPALLEGSDVMCGAFGVSSLERCYLGIPTIGRVIASNQRANAENQVAAFAAIVIPAMECEDSYVRLWIDVLERNPDLVAMMSRKAMSFVSGDSYQDFWKEIKASFD